MLSQNWELMLETCDPELIKAVILCPSTITGASLDHPTRQAIGSLFKKEQLGQLLMGLFVGLPSCWLGLIWSQGGNVRGLLLAGVAITSGG